MCSGWCNNWVIPKGLVGRPKIRWEKDIKVLRILKIDKWSWIKCIQDRVKWKELFERPKFSNSEVVAPEEKQDDKHHATGSFRNICTVASDCLLAKRSNAAAPSQFGCPQPLFQRRFRLSEILTEQSYRVVKHTAFSYRAVTNGIKKSGWIFAPPPK